MSEVSKDTFVRLSVELPIGVEVKTRTTTPRTARPFKTSLDSLFHDALGAVTSSVTERHSLRSNTPIVLDLEFPETLRAEVLAALDKLRTVGRV